MKKGSVIRFFCSATLAVAASLTAWAGVPQVQVKVVLTSVSGDRIELAPGESSPVNLNAPLHAEFISALVVDDGKEYRMFPQWTVKRTYSNGTATETVDYLKRQESVTEYDFTDHGQFQVNFAWSYREKDAQETIPGEYVDSITFTIDNSEITLFNAFSPNGDGINDVYKIYTRSIVNLKIAIFNRWGQTIKTISGRMENIIRQINAEPDNNGGFFLEIWDGSFNGDVVNDGVYFINVQATGASGKSYEKRADINVLKGLGVGE